MEKWSRKLDYDLLYEKYGSPLYVINIDQIKRNFNDYKKLVGSSKNIFFPVKANPSPAVLKEIANLGGGADCASLQEVNLALLSGIAVNQIIYNSQIPDYSLIKKLLASGAIVVADSKEILNEINNQLSIEEIRGAVFIRVNPEYPTEYFHKKEWQSLTSHASNNSKFGIPAEEIVNTKLGLLSMPLALRITGDLSIITALYFSGLKTKNVSVWGIHNFMTCKKKIETNELINIRVSVSKNINYKDDENNYQISQWEIKNKKFNGKFYIMF